MVVSVAFVCLGNICRSPMAEAVFAEQVRQAGLEGKILVDSFGTSAYHVGDLPDRRSASTCRKHNVPIEHNAQQLFPYHFDRFDYILGMDESNINNMQQFTTRKNAKAKLCLFGKYRQDPTLKDIVDDPYYGGDAGFEYNFKQVSDFSRGLLEEIKASL